MKRSEMLQLIQDILATERSKMLGAEKILAALEKAGMLPPITKLGHIDKIDNAWDEE